MPSRDEIQTFTRREHRTVVAAAFVGYQGQAGIFDHDDLVQIVTGGKALWRATSYQAMRNSGLWDDDADWIFEQFEAAVRKRNRLLRHAQAKSGYARN
ncbi:MAG: hypothetical protein NUW22_13545 [Acidobacteria bacterium]|nr:hypothetical protein [Acidobacteriota bacterium]